MAAPTQQRRYRSIEEMYADSAPQSLIDQITQCVFCDPVVSPSTGNTYSRKSVIDFGRRDPCSMELVDTLIPNRNKQEEIEKFYQDKFKETVVSLAQQSIDMHVELIVELIAMVVDRSDLQACLNGQRLLVELIQSSTDDQLGRFKVKLGMTGLGWVAKLVEKQNATILKQRLGIDVSALATAMLQSPSSVPHVTTTASINGSDDDEEEYDFSDTESTTSSVSYTDDTTYVLVDKMPRKTTYQSVKIHFHKYKRRMHSKILFIKGAGRTRARLTFIDSESAQEAVEMMNGTCFLGSATPIVVKIWIDKRRQRVTSEAVTTYDVYVGSNLPSSVTENDIRVHFKMFEPHILRVVLIKDPSTKQSRGFAKVVFTSLQAAQTAIEKLNRSQLPQCKQRLVVNLWKSKKDDVPASPTKSIPEEDNKDAGKKKKPKATEEITDKPNEELVIQNVSVQITGDQLKQMLEGFGDVKRYSINPAPPGKAVYRAEVKFSSKEQAGDAISHLNGQQLAGEKILVRYKKISPETFGVFVGKVPKGLHKQELQDIFAKYGRISYVHLHSGRNHAYVNYFKLDDAKAALDMNNREVHGSKLKVNLASRKTTEPDFPPSLPAPAAIPEPESPKFPSSLPCRPKQSSPGATSSFTVRVRNVSPLTTQEQLTKLVERYGTLTSPVHLIKGDPPYAYVNYATIEAANTACSLLHGLQLDGKTLQVKMKDKDEVAPVSPIVPSVTSMVPPYTAAPTSQLPYPQPPHSIPPLIPSIPPAPQYPMPGAVAPSLPNYSVRQRHASARFNRFLHERMDLKLREFSSFGGSVKWNNDFLTIEAPSVAHLNQFETDVLNVLDEDKVVLSSENWNKLMWMRPDKTSLFDQLVLPYRTNPNVLIEPHNATLSIHIVGMRDAVQDVKITILSELNKEIIVEEVKMMALLKLEPMLKEQSHQNFGATMEGFISGSTKISFSGSSQSVHKAREWFSSLLGQYKVSDYQCQAALIPLAIDRFTADSLSVALCVKCNNGTICYAAQYTASQALQVLLLVCGREPMVQRAIEILKCPEECIVVFSSMEVLQNVKSQSMYDFTQLSQQYRVYICESATPTVTIKGYIKDRVAVVENILNQAKANIEKRTSTLSGSKVKISCLTKALAQRPDQAQGFFMTVFQATSVEIICTDQIVRLTGPADKIQQAEKMIEDSEFLKGYCNRSFEFESHPNFMAQTRNYLTQKFNQQQLNVMVYCNTNKAKKKGRRASKGDVDQPKDTFNVCIESEDSQHFSLACQIVKELKPESRFIRMPKKDFDCLSQAVKNNALDIEGVHHVRFELQDKNRTVAVHGLTSAEINAAEDEIRAYVNANVSVKLSVKVSKPQKYFLAEKCGHLQENCIIHYPKASDFKKEDQEELPQATITLQGDRTHVEVTKQKIDFILSIVSVTQIKYRHEEYGNMWKRRWDEIKRQQEEAYNDVLVITWFDLDERGKKKPKELGVSVEINVTGSDYSTVRQVEQNIRSVPTSLMRQSILVSMDQCKSVAEGLKAKKLVLRENHNVEIEIEWDKKNLTLLAPLGSEDFEAAFATLTAYVKGESVCKEVVALGEPGMSPFIHQKQQWSEIIKVAKRCSVRVKHVHNDLEVFGKPPDIANAKGQLAELLMRFQSSLGTREISVPPLLESVLKSLEFQNLVAKLRQNFCIAVTCRNMQRNVKMVTLYRATVKPEGCDRPCIIEICHGNMVDETTDVIVNAANSELRHIGGLAKAISDAGGPVIQQTSNDYVRQYGIVKPGHVACLPSGNLSCSVVMHAVGPIWKSGGQSKREELYAAVSSSLVESDKHGYRSISIPAISAGIYGCPVEDCAEISIKATTDLLNGNCLKSLFHVRFVLFVWDAANAFKAAFKDCLQKHKNLRTSVDIVDQPSGTRVQWYWEDDTKNLQPYSSEDSLKLSQAYAASPSQSFQITIQGLKYKIDFSSMMQINVGTGKRRMVHRKSLGVVTWQYKDDTGKWTPYTSAHSDLLEVMYETRHMQTLEIGQWHYSFDFSSMLQRNVSTGTSRSIRRHVSGSSANAAEKSVSRQASSSASVSLHGPHQHLTKACDMVDAHFKGCLTTKEISLPGSVSNSVTNQMIRLGQKYNVQAEYMQRVQKLKFHGVSESVTKAVLAAQDILLDIGNKSNMEIPKEWEPQTDNVVIKEVPIGSSEWRHVAQLVLDTLPQVDVMKIERIQNRHLWEKYTFQARRMKEKNNGNINERELFHGTRDTLPEKIYADEEEGFDMRFSRSGMWGQGNYFAEKASYSDTYAYQRPNGTKQMFLAKVLTGDSIELNSDTKLRMPPVKGGSVRYDTVNGVTHGCRVYISYSNDKAYPFYLITYTYLLIQF